MCWLLILSDTARAQQLFGAELPGGSIAQIVKADGNAHVYVVRDGALRKFDSDGNGLSVLEFDGASIDDFALDSSGNVDGVGRFSGTSILTPAPASSS